MAKINTSRVKVVREIILFLKFILDHEPLDEYSTINIKNMIESYIRELQEIQKSGRSK